MSLSKKVNLNCMTKLKTHLVYTVQQQKITSVFHKSALAYSAK